MRGKYIKASEKVIRFLSSGDSWHHLSGSKAKFLRFDSSDWATFVEEVPNEGVLIKFKGLKAHYEG